MAVEVKQKVFAYITHEGRLLVFDHVDFPDAKTQVPAGTRPATEDPAEAVLREAFEETGLVDLKLAAFLGEVDYVWPDQNQLHRRRFYHLICDQHRPPERWQHYETDPSDGGREPILFELFWGDFPDGVPKLPHGHDAMFEPLLTSLEKESNAIRKDHR